ncbi:MAG TPA: APC family permease [Tepidisphaeraceae bacterium]|nr:APC family permease [Tepidisphaeraceae bacterium]
MLASGERPRELRWYHAGPMLFGDWGTSRLYVLGLAFLVAGHSSLWLIAAMSLLILAVAWGYAQICRIYPDGGGVYTAARHRSQLLGVIGALLLIADYTVTASLSAVDAFHYFGLGQQQTAQVETAPDAGEKIVRPHEEAGATVEPLWSLHSPGFWAIVSIIVIGALNLLGPKHTAGGAVFAAVGMVAITLVLVVCALPQIPWRHIDLGTLRQPPGPVWEGFVAIVLALSGVEAIANLTGVMKRPVYRTASKGIWTVAIEVAVFNLILAVAMVAIRPLGRDAHTADMLAFMAKHYIGRVGEWPVRIIGGLLLLSATNTAINGLMSIMYAMSRDKEMPELFQKLNGFGAPWIAAIVAAGVPALVLLFAHDIETLASLYAIGVIGAVAINITLCSIHPRLRRLWRKVPMFLIGLALVAIEITLAITKVHALIFACIVLAIGLTLRQITKATAKRRPKPSLLRQAILEQLPEDAMAMRRILLATAGSATNAAAALRVARREKAALVVCFIRDVALSYKVKAEETFSLETDRAAQLLFRDFLARGHELGVPIIPAYDTGNNSPELIAELAAMNGVERVLIGTSRRGALHTLIKGNFQQKLEQLLPPEIPVEVLPAPDPQATLATA